MRILVYLSEYLQKDDNCAPAFAGARFLFMEAFGERAAASGIDAIFWGLGRKPQQAEGPFCMTRALLATIYLTRRRQGKIMLPAART